MNTNQQQSFSDFMAILTINDVFSLKNILFLSIFTIFNWFFEISKWKLLVKKVQNISFFEATIQSLASLTASLITPNRIGEYGVKALYYKKVFRKKIVVLNFIGNISQLLITFVFGIIGCTYLYFNFTIDIKPINILYFIIIIISLFLSFWFINKKQVTFKGYSFKTLKNYIRDFSKKSIKKIILFSLFRYIIFSHQFYFLLLIFNVKMEYDNALMCIFSMYLIASIIPMLSLFDVVLKGSVAIFVFSFFQVNETTILTIILLMWVFNFMLPSIVGSYFVLTFNTDKLIQPKE